MIAVIIQARMESARLPCKVMRTICNKPMLQRVIERVKQAHTPDIVVVATSKNESNDPIEHLCDEMDIRCFRTYKEDDVLARYDFVANELKADTIVRITGDCPLIDPEIIDLSLEIFGMYGYDFIHNPSYPDGTDVEVFTAHTLYFTRHRTDVEYDREHVTPFMIRRKDLFLVGELRHDIDLSQIKWSVDNIEDLEYARKVYSFFGEFPFRMQDIFRIFGLRKGYKNDGM